MNPNKEKITSVLTDGRVFYIPFYQRAYVWGVKLWRRFIKDMEYISSHDEEYFLGSIILKDLGADGSTATDRQEVIDGQQRLTTFAIFMKVLSLRDASTHNIFDRKFRLDDGRLTIKHSLSDKDAFEKIANLTEDTSLDGEETSNLIKAYNYFRANVDCEKIKINNILAKTVVISIYLENNENEHKIFDTINSLAMKLNTEELLKNFLFKKETLDKYENIWKPVFEADAECINYWKKEYTIGRNKKTISEGFFYTLLQIIMHDPRNNISSEDKKDFRRYDDENIFEYYKTIIASGRWDSIQFAQEIAEYATLYRRIFSKDIMADSDSSKTPLNRILLMVFTLDANTVLPYILYIIKNVPDSLEKNNIFELLESYIVRRQICSCGNKNYSDLFTENLIGQQVKTYDGLSLYLKERNSSLYMPSDNEVKENIHKNNKLSSIKAKCILYLLETKLRAAHPYQTALHEFNLYTTEHIMPQNWVVNWPLPDGLDEIQKAEFSEKRKKMINTLGNLAIITQGLNSSIRDSEWEKKKNGTSSHGGLIKYASDLITLKDVVTKTEWNEEEISKRADWIAEKANSIWKNID